MYYKLDTHPIHKETMYINELDFIMNNSYEMRIDYEKALSGEIVSKGGILPDDNVRVYVPMDLNARNIMWQLEVLYNTLGDVEEKNEFAYRDGVQKLIYQLEVYDQVWIERNLTKVIGNGEKTHSEQGRELAQKMIEYLESEEGSAELFPYEIIDELKEEYGV